MIYDLEVDLDRKDIVLDEHLDKHTFSSGAWKNDSELHIAVSNSVTSPVYLQIPYHGSAEPLTIIFNSILYGSCHGYIEGIDKIITPAQLLLINPDGFYVMILQDGVPYIYSGTDTDFAIIDSAQQSAKLLLKCGPGKNYRYPTTGIDLDQYLNSIVERTDIGEKLMNELQDDGISLESAEFDTTDNGLSIGLANSDNYEEVTDVDASQLKNPDKQ